MEDKKISENGGGANIPKADAESVDEEALLKDLPENMRGPVKELIDKIVDKKVDEIVKVQMEEINKEITKL